MPNRRQPNSDRINRKRVAAITAPSARELSVAIIGAGRLGTALGLALAARGFEITSIIAVHRRNAARAARLITRYSPGGESAIRPPRALATDELHLVPRSRIYLFATPDDALPEASRALARVLREGNSAPRKTAIALHTSGALASGELAVLRELGLSIGSLHPLVAITADASEGALNLQHAFYCIEGEPSAMRVARKLVRALDGRSFTVDSGKKALYHAAAVMTSGHTVALFDTAREMLTRCGLGEREAREVLLPLLASTLRNLYAHAPAQALTGTFARADLATLHLHLAALDEEPLPFAAEVYRLLGRRAAELSKANGADANAIERIEESLAEN